MADEAHETLGEALAASLLPQRDPRGHKGTFGHVFAVAGSLDYAGAALMAGTAALRAGAGMVTLYLPASLQLVLAGRVPELITRAMPETSPGQVDAREAAAMISEQAHDALLVGPGLQPGVSSDRLVAALLAVEGAPAVVDATALHSLGAAPGWWEHAARQCVLTPHPGEFKRLGMEAGSNAEARRSAALGAAQAWGHVVVLKGAESVVAAPDGRAVVAPFSLPVLATAGSGDVLAGIAAAYVAQGLESFEAAALAVYVHGSAGERINERIGDAGMLATDLLAEVPRVRRHLDHIRQREGSRRLGFDAPPGDTLSANDSQR